MFATSGVEAERQRSNKRGRLYTSAGFSADLLPGPTGSLVEVSARTCVSTRPTVTRADGYHVDMLSP